MQSHDDARKQLPPDASRRSFLGVLLGMASALIGILLAVPVLRCLFYPLTAEAKSSGWTVVGSLSEATDAQVPFNHTLHLKVMDGWRETESSPTIYLVKKGNTVQALSAICPHLGCTVPWDAGRNAFVCPCHGVCSPPMGATVLALRAAGWMFWRQRSPMVR